MGNPKQCARCKKILCDKTSLNKHMKKKNQCKLKEVLEDIKEQAEQAKEQAEQAKEDINNKLVTEEEIMIVQKKTEDIIIKEAINNPISEQEQINIDIMKQIDNDIKNIKWETLNKTTFDFPLKKYGRSMLVVGSSFSGKSTFVLKVADMLFNNNKVICTAMLDNPQADIYKKIPKRYLVTDTFRPDICKAMHKINKKTNNRYPFAVITDDILDMRYSSVLRSLLLSWRNSMINTIVSLQGLSLVSLNMKNSVSYFCFRNNSDLSVVETIMKHYLGGRDIFFKKKNMNEKIMLYREIMKDKENTIVLDNITGKLRFIKYKLSKK